MAVLYSPLTAINITQNNEHTGKLYIYDSLLIIEHLYEESVLKV